MSKNVKQGIWVFIFFLSIFMLLSNGKHTTSMDIDVIRYAEEFLESGDYGSPYKLAAGVTYSAKTDLFYPLEGIGVVMPVVAFKYLSSLMTPESDFLLYTIGQILTALSLLFFYLILKHFISHKMAFFYSAVMGLATPILVHSKFLMPEPITMVVFMAVIWCFVKYFYQENSRNTYLFFIGLLAGFSLLCRPDAPVFFLLFGALTIVKLWQKERAVIFKKLSFLFAGVIPLLLLFSYNNYQKFGAVHEFGYTINKEVAKEKLKADLALLDGEIQQKYQVAATLYGQDQNSEATKTAVESFNYTKQVYDSKKSYYDELVKNFSFVKFNKDNIITTYFYGLYLILIYPNRSLFFLSPILLLLFIPLGYLLKKYRTETIFLALIIGAYISVYALRAPLSYAGSAAWGIRYLLPTMMIAGLAFIGFEQVRLNSSKKSILKKITLTLFVISTIFQLIGSAVNYQSVQMPLEFACKQRFGQDNMEWADQSRGQLMVDYSASLLINNWQIINGSIPQVLANNLSSELLEQLKSSNQLENGANDWLFYDLLNKRGRFAEGSGRANYSLLLFLLIGLSGSSLYFILRKEQNR